MKIEKLVSRLPFAHPIRKPGTTGFAAADYEGSNHWFPKRPYDGYMYSLLVIRIGYAMTVTAIVSGSSIYCKEMMSP